MIGWILLDRMWSSKSYPADQSSSTWSSPDDFSGSSPHLQDAKKTRKLAAFALSSTWERWELVKKNKSATFIPGDSDHFWVGYCSSSPCLKDSKRQEAGVFALSSTLKRWELEKKKNKPATFIADDTGLSSATLDLKHTRLSPSKWPKTRRIDEASLISLALEPSCIDFWTSNSISKIRSNLVAGFRDYRWTTEKKSFLTRIGVL